jgi:hypothetical protein
MQEAEAEAERIRKEKLQKKLKEEGLKGRVPSKNNLQ